MATFPKLKTGAVAQYPITRHEVFQNQTVRFVDGTEQRFRDRGAPQRRWVIELGGLDENESAILEEFVLEQQGGYGSFAFTDPWDGHVYEDCSLELDDLTVFTVAEMRCRMRITVIRNR